MKLQARSISILHWRAHYTHNVLFGLDEKFDKIVEYSTNGSDSFYFCRFFFQSLTLKMQNFLAKKKVTDSLKRFTKKNFYLPIFL